MKTKKISLSILFMILLTLLSKITGFSREIAIAYTYGSNEYTDAFFLSTSVPLLIFSGFTIALSSVFIPIYSKINIEKGQKEALNYTNNLLLILVSFSMILSVITIIYSENIIDIISPGLGIKSKEISNGYLKILLISFGFFMITAVFSSYLQVINKPLLTVSSMIPSNLLLVFTILVYQPNLKIIVFISLIGFLLQSFILYYFSTKNHFKIKLVNHFFENEDEKKYIKITLVSMIPMFISTSFQNINLFVDRYLASTFPIGSITAINYADRLNGFVFGIVATSIATVVFPILSRSSIENRRVFDKTITNSMKIVAILTAPISIIVFFHSDFIILTLLQRGSLTVEDAKTIALLLKCYSIGMIFLGFREILNRVFFALNDTKTPFINGFFTIIFNIIFSVILSSYYGLSGIILATSIASIFTTILLLFSLNKKHNIRLGSYIYIELTKIIGINLLFLLVIQKILMFIFDVEKNLITFVLYIVIYMTITILCFFKFKIINKTDIVKGTVE